MGRLDGRTVVLGVAGGIATYKAVEVCRRLVSAGAYVAPIMTESATRFLGAATLSALAGTPVQTSLWSGPDPIPHTALGRTADVVAVVPATASLLARYAAGMADDLLSATLLATRAPVVVCPAMHTEMWEHPAVRDNVERLRRRGVVVVDPEVGVLAGGDVGMGRLATPEDIVAAVEAVLVPNDLTGVRVLVTAGGTREPIDPVRFIANRSSGKQGHALADEAVARGAHATLVTTVDRAAASGVEVVKVATAQEMSDAVLELAPFCDVVVMAAAVSDFRPMQASPDKIRKADGVPELILEPTPDILTEVAARRRPGQVIVGFAADTGDLAGIARAKLQDKGVDLVVANDIASRSAGFDHDTNEGVVVDSDGGLWHIPLMSKRSVAARIMDLVAQRIATTDKRSNQ